jgi:hypothetical protein
MSVTSILSSLGYSEEFIQIIDSVIDNQPYNEDVIFSDQDLRSYDSNSCYIEESNAPVDYTVFSNAID